MRAGQTGIFCPSLLRAKYLPEQRTSKKKTKLQLDMLELWLRKQVLRKRLATRRRVVFELCAGEAGAVAAEDGQKLLKKQCNNSVQPQRRSNIFLHMFFL